MKNKGFTLIELLVAMAIGSIILLMLSFMLVQGSNMFNSENDEINMRNDYQIVQNEIVQTIMEAKTIAVVRAGEDIVIYTGEVDTKTNKLVAESGTISTERIITYIHDDDGEGKLYVSTSLGQATSEGNLFCNKVTEFDISFSDKCLKDNGKEGDEFEEYYVNPLEIDITLNLAGDSNDMASTVSVRARNILRQVSIYTVGNRNRLLANATVESYRVK